MKQELLTITQQEEVYQFMKSYQANYGRCPTVIEVAKQIKENAYRARYIMRLLKAKGRIKSVRTKKRFGVYEWFLELDKSRRVEPVLKR